MAFVFFCFVIFLTANTTVFDSYGQNERDHLALLSFKSMVSQDDPYGALTSWNSSYHFCDWIGVTCGKKHKRVTVIRLESQGLHGSLSPHIGNLSFLRKLQLQNNSFQGSIPCELGCLSRLRVLDLVSNNFSGVFPSNLSRCSNLKELLLGHNKLVESIPKEICFLSRLTLLVINKNKFTGGIPPFLGNVTSMEEFSASGNPFGGSIPDSLGRWKSLRKFYLMECNLHGTIPHSIFNLSLLTTFSLKGNQLTGSLPPTVGTMLPNLFHLQFYGNKFSGLLPPSISNCSKLYYLNLGLNSFRGELTIDFAKVKDISVIHLSHNTFLSIREANVKKFIDSLGNCSRLEKLGLSNINIHAVLPISIGNLSHRLHYLHLGGNHLYGSLPSSIGNLARLIFLKLEANQFTGKIPSTIGMLQKLVVAFLSENQFSGLIPDAIGNLSVLDRLNLNSNRLEGNIPPIMGNFRRLSILDLENNELCGQIPKQLFQLTHLLVLYLSNNSLSGSLPTEVGDLKQLYQLRLCHNNLSGNIPSSLGFTRLISLRINNNLFEGTVPLSLSKLVLLSELNLSHNNLSGQIPQFLEQFRLLKQLDLSFNDFEGQVPVKGVFSNASAFLILGNSRLCGGLVELGLPKCKTAKKHNKRFTLYILVSCMLSVVLCFVHVGFKKKRNGQHSQSFRNERFLNVSYDQLLRATDGFSEANLICKGGLSSIYKGILDHDDKFVAVKVLHLQIPGAHESFIAECQAWKSIRHRNLLNILTPCSSVDFHGNDFKALVYEFMPNGSLDDWLHSNANASRLDLFQRINILIDVAFALDYLHNQCLTTVVHGDLKASNILLDNDMVARIGDFGLIRFLGENSKQNNSSGVKGTIGYVAPEYGHGSEMSSSGDVYSFGILLLEVMTRKKPTDDIFNGNLSLHKLACMALRDRVIDVIDGDVVVQSTGANSQIIEDCFTSIVRIGVSCSVDSPSQRMDISNVIPKLMHIRDAIQNILH